MPHRLACTTLARLTGVALLLTAAIQLAAASPAAAASPSAWQPLSGPPQNNGAIALDDTHHRLFTFGGENTDMVRVMTLDGYPYPWALFTAAGTPPAVRSATALQYDSARDRLLLFGGINAAGHSFNDVWSLNLSGTPTWSKLTTTGPGPDPRSDASVCYDTATNKLFVFGGLDSLGNDETSTLYALDLSAATPTWSHPFQGGAVPTSRAGSQFALDPFGRRIYLFGGTNNGGDELNDEYELNLNTFTWASAPMTGIIPDARDHHVCVWDRNDQQLIVWGGNAVDDSLRAMSVATREWRSLNWFIGPPTRSGPSLGFFDWQGNRVVVLAGSRGSDAYTFYKLDPTNFWYGTGPTRAPIGGSMVLDRANARTIAYGGIDWPYNSVIGDFWQYSFTNPQGWNGVNTGGVTPPQRVAHVAVWDQKHDRMLVIEGRDENNAPTNSVFALSDSADFMNWKGLATSGTAPTPRTYSAGIYDPVGDRVLLFGGIDANNLRGGLSQLALTPSPAWSTIAATGGPRGRAGATAIYDEPRRRMILFGGADSVTGNYQNDVWSLSLPGLTWTHLLPTGTPPLGRWKHNAVYDSRRGRMVVFGGRESNADSADVWELSLTGATPAWTRLVPTGWTPLYRSDAAAVYDSLGDRMIIYGGSSLIAPNLAVGEVDLWALQFSGSNVTAVAPAELASGLRLGEPWPNPARGGSRVTFELAHPARVQAAVYDLAGRRVRGLATGALAAGPHELAWDGRDEAGTHVAAGLYFYRVDVDGQHASRKVVLTR
jgi:hypothetical protein